MTDNNKPHFVNSKNFHGDNEYIEWLREIKSRYQAVRSRVALQANYPKSVIRISLCRTAKRNPLIFPI